MNWSDYLYLAPAAVAAAVALALATRLMPALRTRSARRTRGELLLVGAVCALGLLVVYFNFYAGRQFFAYGVGDVGSDTLEQYVPFYFDLVRNVREGTLSAWNFEYDLGVSYATYQSWLLDPFNLVVVPVCLLLGDSAMGLALVVSQSVKVVLSAYLFDHLLTRYCETPLARAAGALLYAFSGFMMLYGQHYWLGSVFPVFTLTMLLFELYLERGGAGRLLGLVAVVALLVAWSPYIAFMVLLFAALYLLVRIPHALERVTARAYLLAVLRMAVPVVCGLLLSGVLLLPYATYLLGETSRTSSDASLAERAVSHLGLVSLDWVPATLSRFLGSGLINTGSAPVTEVVSAHADIDFTGSFPYEYILLGYSGGALVLLSQFFHWAFTECPRRDRALVGAATALVLLYCFGQFLPTLFNAMVKLQYRSSFVLALPVCAAMAVGLERRVMAGRVARWPLAVSSALTLAVLAWSLLNTVTGRLVCLCYLAVTLVVVACVALIALGRGNRDALLSLTVGAMVAMSVADGFFCTNSRGFTSSSTFPLTGAVDTGEDTVAALEYLEEHDDTYYRVDKMYSTWTPVNDSLIQGYSGTSAYNSSPDAEVYEFRRELWPDSIFRSAAWSWGFKFDPNRPEILQLLNVKYFLSTQPYGYEWCEPVTQVGDVYVYRNALADSIASVRQDVVGESEASALPSADERRALLATSVIVPDEVARELEGALSPEAATDAESTFRREGSNRVVGTISCEASSVVCLAVPHTATWHVSVDGQEVETFRANYGFVGISLPAGTHEVEMTFVPAGIEAGAAMSAAGVVATVAAAAVVRRGSRGEAPSASGRHFRDAGKED